MLRTLLTRRWLTALTVAALFATVCVFLGRWQYGRHLDASSEAQLVANNLGAPPVPLGDVLPAGSPPLPADRVWTRVSITGRYDGARQLMARNRPQDTIAGYEVLVPLVLPGGDALLVDRGWVRNAERADLVPRVPPSPEGEVTVVGWLRQGEVQVGVGLPEGQLASINLAQAQAATGRTLRPAYLVMEAEDDGSGRPPPRPQALIPPDTDLGPHLAYALQWWLAAPVGFVIVFVYARREHREAAGIERAPRARKPRIWDEEDA